MRGLAPTAVPSVGAMGPAYKRCTVNLPGPVGAIYIYICLYIFRTLNNKPFVYFSEYIYIYVYIDLGGLWLRVGNKGMAYTGTTQG